MRYKSHNEPHNQQYCGKNLRNAKEDKAGVNGFLIFKVEYLFLIFILILNTPCGWSNLLLRNKHLDHMG